MGHPGVGPLWTAAKRSGINLMRKEVEAYVRQKGEKQVLSAVQPSKGKTLGESQDARWQMDLAFGNGSVFLVCVNVFDRFTYAKTIANKEPASVAPALEALLQLAPKMPKLITSDNGNEFLGPVSTLLTRLNIAQRYKAVGDVNAIGVVDRTIQTLKRKLAELAGARARPWSAILDQAVQGMNDTPKPVLHGDAPSEVRGDDDVSFMLQQDQARSLQHNKKLTARRQNTLEDAGGFRAPLPDSTSKFKRGFQATYGDVKQMASIRGSTVTDTDGGKHNIKQLKIVPATSSAAIPAAASTAGPAKKKRLGAPILNALAQVLEGEERISLTKASGLMRTQMTANGQNYNEILKATKASLIDLIRLDDDRFELVIRPDGPQNYYFVALK
jgi:hypothetical protein